MLRFNLADFVTVLISTHSGRDIGALSKKEDADFMPECKKCRKKSRPETLNRLTRALLKLLRTMAPQVRVATG